MLRVRGRGRSRGGDPGVGEVVERARGASRRWGRYDAYQRRARRARRARGRRGAARRARARGGVAGALDAVRRRAEARARARAARRRRRRCCAAWCSARTSGSSEAVRDGLPAARGSRTCSRCRGQNVMLLAIARARRGAVALGLAAARAARRSALALVALYVPLAGGGPSIQRAGVMGAAGLVAALAGRPGVALVRARPRRGRDARAQPARRRASRAGSSRSPRSSALLALAPALREALARAAARAAGRRGRDHRSRPRSATAPLMALHFEQVSLASLPANLLAAPAVAPIMWLGMLSAAAGAGLARAAPRRSNALDGPLLAYLEWVARTRGAGARGGRAGAARRRRPRWRRRTRRAGGAARRRRGPRVGGGRRRPRRAAARAAGAALAAVRAASRGVALARGARARRAAAPARRARRLVPRRRPGRRDAAPGRRRRPCSSTPGRPAARSCSGCARRACGGSTLLRAHPPVARPRGHGAARRARADPAAAAARRRRRHARPRRPARLLRRGRRARDPPRRGPRAGRCWRSAASRLRVLWPRRGRPAAAAGRTRTRAPWSRSRAPGASTCCCRPTRVARHRAAAAARSRRSRSPTTAAPTPGCPRVLERLRPQVAAIEVGAGNTYGHPTPATLAALRGRAARRTAPTATARSCCASPTGGCASPRC